MNKKFKGSISRRFGQAADSYDSASDIQLKIGEKLLSHYNVWIGDKILPGRILELGCGTGRFTDRLLTCFPGAGILATDLAEGMIAATIRKLGDNPRLAARVMDADHPDLSEEEGAFELICSNMASQWFADLKSSFDAQSRLLAPGGIMIHTVLGQDTFHEWRDACAEAGQPVSSPRYPTFEEIKGMVPDGHDGRWHRESLQQQFSDSWSFLDYLRNIGARATLDRPMSTAMLRKACRIFEDKYAARVSYDVAYCLFLRR